MLCAFLAGQGLIVSQVFELMLFQQQRAERRFGIATAQDETLGFAEILLLLVIKNLQDTENTVTVGHRGGVHMRLRPDPWMSTYESSLFPARVIQDQLAHRLRSMAGQVRFTPRINPYELSDEQVDVASLDVAPINLVDTTPAVGDDRTVAGGWFPYTSYRLSLPAGPDKTYLAAISMTLAGRTYVDLVPGSKYFSIDGVATLHNSIATWDLRHPHFDRSDWREDFAKLREIKVTPEQYDVLIGTPALAGLATVQESQNMYVQREYRADRLNKPAFDHFVTTSDRFCLRVGFANSASQVTSEAAA